ncbi:MAG: amidohydrolase family protein [Acidobacteria bacterium]|nr:amidohydrolase family protein [Acidobacteriota bacterium]
MKTFLIDQPLVAGMTSAADLTPDGAVLVEDGRITALHGEAREKAAALVRKGEPFERIDASGFWLLPGFVQTHIHLCQTLLRNGPDDLELLPWLQQHVWPGEAAHTDETLEVSARLGIAELLSGGTTAILDMGTVRHTDAIFRAARDLGFRLTGGNALMDDPELNPAYLRLSPEETLAETSRLAHLWHGAASGRLRFAFCPRFALSCTHDLLVRVGERARSDGFLIHTHASENRTEIRLVKGRTGKANVEYLNEAGLCGARTVLAHVIHVNDEERALLCHTGTAVAHCPSSNFKLASGMCPIPEYRQQGIRVSLGADGAPCNDRLDVFSEMRLAALMQKVRSHAGALSAYEVVRMATIEGADALGLGSETGTIEIGKKADLVLLDPSFPHCQPQSWRKDPFGPIVYSFDRTNVVATFVEGELCYHRALRPVSVLAPAAAEIENAVEILEERKRRLLAGEEP